MCHVYMLILTNNIEFKSSAVNVVDNNNVPSNF